MLNKLRDEIHNNAKNHGFYDDEDKNIPEMLMLVVSELGEAMEAYRKDHYADIDKFYGIVNMQINQRPLVVEIFEKHIKDTFQDEIADSIIRLFDLCGYMKIDIDEHIRLKMKYNETRPYKHGKKC